jgi:ERCC4-related helicase
MTGKQAELYQLIDDATDVLIDMGEDDLLMVRNALAKIVKLQQVTSNPRLLGYTYYESPSCKEDWLTDWMKDHQDESVVIFCQFRDTVRWLARKFRIERVLGGFDNQKPKDLSKVNRLVATIAAAGEGVDLPHINTAIFYDVIWPARRMTQAIDRIQRLSSTEPKQIIYLTIPDTVDETVYFAVQNKWSFHKLIYTLIQRKRAKAQDTTSGQP